MLYSIRKGGAASSSVVLTGSVFSTPFAYKASTDPQTYLKYEVEGDLAISAESPDAQHWTLRLQPAARFQDIPPVDGHPVQAEDVKASFTRAFAKPNNTYKSLLPMIDPAQIQTPAPDTAVFQLKYPYAPFRETLTYNPAAVILPREALAGAYDPATAVIGSGPFSMGEYTPDVALVLKKTPAWFKAGLPYVDQVRAAIIPDASQQLSQFAAGHLDAISPQPKDVGAVKQNNPNARVISTLGSSYAFFGHMNDPASPWRDIRIRRAVSMSLDRAAMKKVIFNNEFTDNQIIPAALGKWTLPPDKFGDAAQYYAYNPAEAKKLVSASGGTAGSPQLARFLYPVKQYGPAFDAMAEMISSMLNQAGFKIQLVPIDYNKDFIGGGKGALFGNYPADALLFSADVVFGNAEETLNAHFQSASARNKPRVNDPALDQMLAKMESTVDDGSRLQQALDIQKYLAGMIYEVPTPDQLRYTALQPWVNNFYLIASGTTGTNQDAFPTVWLKR